MPVKRETADMCGNIPKLQDIISKRRLVLPGGVWETDFMNPIRGVGLFPSVKIRL